MKVAYTVMFELYTEIKLIPSNGAVQVKKIGFTKSDNVTSCLAV